MSVDHHHYHSTPALVLIGAAIICFVLAVFSVPLPTDKMIALGLALFAAGHLV